jgi:hypothetical protein
MLLRITNRFLLAIAIFIDDNVQYYVISVKSIL